MITINFSNIESLIFSNDEIQNKLPEFKDLFQQWKLGLFAPSLRPMAQKALFDLLNQLNDEHVRILETYFATLVKVEKFDYTLIKNYKIPLSNSQDKIECLDINGEMFVYRDANYLYISTWH